MTHTEAEAKFKICRNKKVGYKLANNTRLQKRGKAFAVRLHETDIVMIRPDGTYRLNSGGWRTVTTKSRINSFVNGAFLSQKNSIWSIGGIVFYDGMLLDSSGRAINSDKNVQVITTAQTQRSVDYYCREFIKSATQACVGVDIGRWHTHNKHKLPEISKGHIANFWKAINESSHLETKLWEDDPSRYHKWVYWAIVSRRYSDPLLIWTTIRDSCLRRAEPCMIQNSLRSFTMNRKPMIIDQIVFGDLTVRNRMV